MKFGFLTHAFGWYQDFVPLYIFSCLYTCPSFVRVLLHEELTENNRRALELIRPYNGSFEVIQNYRGVDLSHIDHLPAVRFLLPREAVADLDYVYIGDVDFIVYNEVDDNFFEYYLKHCRATGLPFSNSVTNDDGQLRMTGLHFIKVEEYYEVMQREIQAVVQGKNKFAQSIRKSYSYDEQVLYDMISRSFDLSSLDGYVRPHHGVHFGYVRKRQTGHSFARKTRLAIWLETLPKLEPILHHPIFRQLVDLMCPRAQDLVRRVETILYRPIFL